MESKKNLFAKYDPYEKEADLFCQTAKDGSGRLLSIRPFYVVSDLIIIDEWLNAELCKTNWHLNRRQMAAMQHYKQMVESVTTQSLMLEQNHQPVMQIDLLPPRLARYPKSAGYNFKDCALHYIYRESFRDPDMFTRSLAFVISFIFSHPEIRYVYLHPAQAGEAMSDLLALLGFERLGLKNIFGKSLNIHRISRPASRFNS
jgi:RimJ/RimL family protein N-acetyltransferase